MSTKQFPLMECGCVASSLIKKANGWVKGCGVHGCTKEAEEQPDLTGRKAKCSYGGAVVNSSFSLAFFKYKPDEEYDEYYCGCYGWD